MLLGIFLSVLQIGIRDAIYIYCMFLTVTIAFFIMTPVQSAMFLAASYGCFFLVCFYYNIDINNLSVIFLNMTAMHISCYLLQNIIFKMKYQMFIDKEMLIDKNRLLAELSVKDQMTNINNHESICMHLQETINISIKHGTRVSIAILDIDDFKKVNDNYGHIVGDEVLKQFADIIKSSVRETDAVGRYGGEEFLIVFNRTNAEDALEVVKRIRTKVHNTEWSQNLQIRFSAGVSEFAGELLEELIADADKKLYYVKKNGKDNCILAIPEEVA